MNVKDEFVKFLPPSSNIRRISAVELEIVIKGDEYLYIIGQCYVQVLSGTVDIAGFRAEHARGQQYVCSPKCFSLIPLINKANESVIRLISLQNGLPAIQGMQSAFSDIFTFTFEQSEDIPGCWIVRKPCRDLTFFEAGNRWDSIAGELAPVSNQIILVCGSRKVGKSTFCRYMCNRLLNYHTSVAFFDFDTGQSEFTTPGFVSYSLRLAPLLSPPFANIHIPPTDSRFYGAMGPSENPKLYLECCLELWNSYRTFCVQNRIPIIINTMGWISGLGLALLSHILHAIVPTHVLAFGEDDKDDYVSKALFSESGFANDVPFADSGNTLVAYLPPAASLGALKLSPADSRSLNFWSYFYFNSSTGLFDFSLPLAKRQPFVIQRRLLSLHFMDQVSSSSVWAALNCSIVGLLSNPSARPGELQCKTKIAHEKVLGMGFVRGVDPQSGVIYLLTPLPLEIVSQCNMLLVSSISLPPAIMTHGQLFNGPYVSFQSSFETSGFTPRKVRHNIVRQSTQPK